MRYIAFFLLLLSAMAARSQNTVPALTMNGIGEVRVNMKLSELRKLTGQPLKLTKLLGEKDWDRDTFSIVYKDIPCQVVIDRDYLTEAKNTYLVVEIISQSALLKTKSGIGIGDDKMKIINTYPDYFIQLMPEYEGSDYTVKSKTRSTVQLNGDDGQVITFYLTNNKVTGFSVRYNEGC